MAGFEPRPTPDKRHRKTGQKLPRIDQIRIRYVLYRTGLRGHHAMDRHSQPRTRGSRRPRPLFSSAAALSATAAVHGRHVMRSYVPASASGVWGRMMTGTTVRPDHQTTLPGSSCGGRTHVPWHDALGVPTETKKTTSGRREPSGQSLPCHTPRGTHDTVESGLQQNTFFINTSCDIDTTIHSHANVSS